MVQLKIFLHNLVAIFLKINTTIENYYIFYYEVMYIKMFSTTKYVSKVILFKLLNTILNCA
jgi:hypothetical protein